MPLIMKKIFNITGNYTPEEKDTLLGYIELFRGCISDSDPDKNIINGKIQQYTDDQIIFFFNRALKDLNSGSPKCSYSLFNFPDDDLLMDGAMIFTLISEGILQLRNQVSYSDSGLSINLFDKTAGYQGWAGFLLQQYDNDKRIFKSTIVPMSVNSGFVGIGSEFGYDGW